MFRKSVSIFLVILFLAYSGGFGFSLHECDHCHAVKVYFFQHPDCCPASEAEHHHGEWKNYAHEQGCSHHQEDDDNEGQCPNNITKISPEAYTAHCTQCCLSDFVYFKIKSNYIPSQYDNLFHLGDDFNSIILFGLSPKNGILPQLETVENNIHNKEIPPLLSGGKPFIIYSHKLLLYS